MKTQKDLHAALDEVIDPELGIGIYSLGLIYDSVIEYDDTGVPLRTDIVMTFTSPFCPYADAILEQVESTITLYGFGAPHVQVTFDPVWQPSETLRARLGL